MKKLSLTLFISFMSVAGISIAQTSSDGVRESTDPARAAAVEAEAQRIAREQAGSGAATSGASGATGTTRTSGTSGVDASPGVRESTDPARAAAVEAEAQRIAREQGAGGTTTSGVSGAAGTTGADATSGVRESTDPARAAAVEAEAQRIAREQAARGGATSGAGSATGTTGNK